MSRLKGCQSTNHQHCGETLWRCARCQKSVCDQEGTTDKPELCDDCWAENHRLEEERDRARASCRRLNRRAQRAESSLARQGRLTAEHGRWRQRAMDLTLLVRKERDDARRDARCYGLCALILLAAYLMMAAALVVS